MKAKSRMCCLLHQSEKELAKIGKHTRRLLSQNHTQKNIFRLSFNKNRIIFFNINKLYSKIISSEIPNRSTSSVHVSLLQKKSPLHPFRIGDFFLIHSRQTTSVGRKSESALLKSPIGPVSYSPGNDDTAPLYIGAN